MSHVLQCDGCDRSAATEGDRSAWLRLRSSLHARPNRVLAEIDLCEHCKTKFAVALRKIIRKDALA